MRSGALVQLRIAKIRSFDFDARGFSDDPRDIADQIDADPSEVEGFAREDGADVLMFVRNADLDSSQQKILCGIANVGVANPTEALTPKVILACEEGHPDDGRAVSLLTAPHEFGHIFGLGHELSDPGRVEPHLEFGIPYESRGITTLMSTESDESKVLPFFSSPFLFLLDEYWGSGSTNAAQAINQAATNVALHWEIKNGVLSQSTQSFSTNSTAPTEIEPELFTPSPYAEERPLIFR